MSVPVYCFKTREDLPDLGLVEGECLMVSPCDRDHPILATHPITPTPAQVFDAIMAGTLKPERCCHLDNANPVYALQHAVTWQWEEATTAEDGIALTHDETVEVFYQIGIAVLPEAPGSPRERRAEMSANLVTPELHRRGYRLIGPKPSPHQKVLLKLG